MVSLTAQLAQIAIHSPTYTCPHSQPYLYRCRRDSLDLRPRSVFFLIRIHAEQVEPLIILICVVVLI